MRHESIAAACKIKPLTAAKLRRHSVSRLSPTDLADGEALRRDQWNSSAVGVSAMIEASRSNPEAGNGKRGGNWKCDGRRGTGDRDGDPDVGMEVETCGNYERERRAFIFHVRGLTHTTNSSCDQKYGRRCVNDVSSSQKVEYFRTREEVKRVQRLNKNISRQILK